MTKKDVESSLALEYLDNYILIVVGQICTWADVKEMIGGTELVVKKEFAKRIFEGDGEKGTWNYLFDFFDRYIVDWVFETKKNIGRIIKNEV
jgi:hypothetical protein